MTFFISGKLFSLRPFVAVILFSSVFAHAVQAQVFDMVVAKDGSSRYSTIQSALERIPLNNAERKLIFVKNGTYNEKVWLYANKPNVSIIGESEGGVVISWDDYSGKEAGMSTAQSYTFLVEGDDFYGENLVIENTAGNVGQAVAVRTTGDRQIFKNCRFLGFQDTYYAHKNRQYNLDCYVEGATDFIFGDATTVFENSTINSVKGGQYITAPNDTKLISTTASGDPFYHGLLFLECLLTADEDVPANSYYLGRPWGAPGSAVYIDCTLGEHIKPAGWSEWNDNNHLNGTFAEFHNKDVTGKLVETSQRVTWSEQLTAEEVEAYYNLEYFFKKNGVVWNPRPSTVALDAAAGLEFNSRVLSWQEVSDAKGYAIYRNGELAGLSETNSFEDTEVEGGSENVYQVKTVSSNGNLSALSEELTAEAIITGVKNPTNVSFDVSLTGSDLKISEMVTVLVYTPVGSLVKREENTRLVSMDNLQKGVYIIKMMNKKGEELVKKILL